MRMFLTAAASSAPVLVVIVIAFALVEVVNSGRGVARVQLLVFSCTISLSLLSNKALNPDLILLPLGL